MEQIKWAPILYYFDITGATLSPAILWLVIFEEETYSHASTTNNADMSPCQITIFTFLDEQSRMSTLRVLSRFPFLP